jgi:predicted porin
MKKTLIALAALAAAGASFAQSSVTLYGVADVAVGKTNKAGLGLANDQFQAIASNVLNNGTSRFGLKGVEDLGGGLKAGFNFEGGLSLANGAGNLSGGQLFSRAANMSLMGGFGELRAGRTLTTSFYSIASWELTGAANYSVVANQFGFAGAGPRDSGVVMYNSPNFSGFSFSASTILKGNNVYVIGGEGKGKYDLSATYANGPIVASFAYNKVQDGNKGYALGGKYDFGPAAVAASIQKSQDNSGTILAKGYTLGVSGNVGAVGLTFDYARDSQFKDSDYLLEAKYPLSKRTFAYAVYMRDGKGKTAESVNGYSLGLRHNF